MSARDWMLRNTNEATDARQRHDDEQASIRVAEAFGRLLLIDRDRLARVLAWHLLAGPECDHEAKTDTAACACGQWRSAPLPSVGAAIDAWAQHVIAVLAARPATEVDRG